ncbi:MAG: RNA methyltransferase [bacterium]|nr:RNA methyltransferase [bacterium]
MITSLQNPQIKNVIKLRSKKQERDRQGLMIIEGAREVERALRAGVEMEQIYFCTDFLVGEQPPHPRAEQTSREVFEKISYREHPDGILAVGRAPTRRLSDISLSQAPLLVVAESIEKPGNLGAILRSADAVKADGVLVCDQCTDVNNPNVIRASTGTVFTVPLAECGSEEALQWLKKNSIQIVAASPAAQVEYTDVDLSKPTAIVVGSEQNGLSKKWLEQCDLQVKIPMGGIADSLNVATATTILLFEARRQRKSGHK